MLARSTALKGVKVLEFAGLAPSPFCGMILADQGADVIRIDRVAGTSADILGRGKKSIVVDLKQSGGKEIIKKLCSKTDVLIEPFRPGVMERLGLGPMELVTDNQRLIYTRMSGYGQFGPHSFKAGHDINYISRNGLLSLFGRTGQHPTPPVNLAADFAGGGLMAAMGIMAALLKRSHTGLGSIVDANLAEGSAYVATWLYASQNLVHRSGVNVWGNPRGENYLDTGNCFYNTYKTKDGQFMSVGATDNHLQLSFLEAIGLDFSWVATKTQNEIRSKIEQIFSEKTRSEWEAHFKTKDICVEPVYGLEEAFHDVHSVARKSFIPGPKGSKVPQIAPRILDFGKTCESQNLVSHKMSAGVNADIELSGGEHTDEILRDLNYSKDDIDRLRKHKIVQ